MAIEIVRWTGVVPDLTHEQGLDDEDTGVVLQAFMLALEDDDIVQTIMDHTKYDEQDLYELTVTVRALLNKERESHGE